MQGRHKNKKTHGDWVQKTKGKKTVAEKQPSELPKTKKHKSMDSDEDDEVPQNEPGTSSNSQPSVTVLPFNTGSAANSQGLAAPYITLRMKTVSIAMNLVHKVRIPKGLWTTQICTF